MDGHKDRVLLGSSLLLMSYEDIFSASRKTPWPSPLDFLTNMQFLARVLSTHVGSLARSNIKLPVRRSDM